MKNKNLEHERSAKLYNGDCLEVLATLPENSVDTCITDPPYHLTSIVKRFGSETAAPTQYGTDGAFARASKGFMGKTWDGGNVAADPATWTAVYRVLKPGALLLAFGGTRTYHRMVCAIEDAGFEIRDTIAWVYGSGFPKSYNIGKGIDKAQGNERKVTRVRTDGNKGGGAKTYDDDSYIWDKPFEETVGNSGWDGWGTALKPAWEIICVAMKPIDGTFVNNALTWGVAGLNIDGGRVGYEGGGTHCNNRDENRKCLGHPDRTGTAFGLTYHADEGNGNQGRFPANFIHDGSDDVVSGFPNDSARFFMTCKQDDLCSLCLTPKHSIMSNIDNSEVIQCKSLFANNVEKSLTTTQATTLNIAQESVQDWLIEKAVHFAKSAGNLCEKCATSIVREVVEVKTWDSKNVVSPVIQDFIGNSNKCILIQNLAQYAEIWDSIDTTPTTTSLLTLFGYASRVITNYIQETEKTAPKRFLYSPKASRKERNAGLEGMPKKPGGSNAKGFTEDVARGLDRNRPVENHHPTVKPIELMRYLVRLTKTPTGGVVLDPFAGSGTTGIACVLEGREFIGIEREAEYVEIAEKRIAHAENAKDRIKAEMLPLLTLIEQE